MKKLLAILLASFLLIEARGDPIGDALIPPVLAGAGSPEGVVTGAVGTLYRNTTGGAAVTLYVKESGSGNTGWVAYGSPSGSGAPTTATFITQTANGSLSAEQALSLLSTGFAFVTNGTGVVSTFTIESQESALEAVMDLENMQGAVTDAQVPDTITLTYSNYETGFEGVLDLQDLQGAITDGQVPNNITVDLAATATALATPRTIGNVSFNGTANIVPQTIQVLDTAVAVTYPALFESATGNLAPKTDAGLSYDASSGTLSTLLSFADTDSNYAATNVGAAIEELNSVDGSGPNTATAKVDWSQLGNVPAGFADGTDDGGGGGGADADAIHDNISGEINAITDKATPVAADHILIEDSAASNAKKDITIGSQESALEGVMDLQDFQGSVTDSQVPDSITVSTALTGDSATGFFTSGQIERARGGLGADTSAYGVGLLGSSAANATVDVDTVAELETSLAGANVIDSTEIDTVAEVNALVGDGNFVSEARSITIAGTSNEITSSTGSQDLSNDRTWTLSLPAVIDIGGKTSFELPNAAAPTVSTFGQIAGDNNLWGTNRGAPIFFDGTAAVALIGALVSDTPTDGQIPRFNDSTDTVTWETISAVPGGSDTQLQFNDGGNFGGTAGLTWNDATSTLSIATLGVTNLNAVSLRVLDNVDQSHAMVIVANENLTTDINLMLDLNGATRSLEVADNAVLSGTNTGDQTITLTGEVTGTGTGSFATTIADSVSVTNWTLTTPTMVGAITYPDNVRQTFNPGATNAGFNAGSQAGDPSTPSNGDIWYDSTANTLDARINGATVQLGAGGAGGAPTDATYLTTTANGTLSAEVVVGATPAGELGGTWAAPTIADTVTVTGWTMGASVATTPTANDNDTSLATTAYVQTELTAYNSDTKTLTNTTLDALATGNVVKFRSFPQFTSPLRVDGTNCTIGTTATAIGYGLGTFTGSDSIDQAANWMEFRIMVPSDWDVSVEPLIRIVDMTGADTSTRQYVASMASVAVSGAATGTLINPIVINMSADAGAVAGDVQVSSSTALTNWGSSCTPGNLLVIRIARDSNTATFDTSTVASTVLAVELAYGSTQ